MLELQLIDFSWLLALILLCVSHIKVKVSYGNHKIYSLRFELGRS